MNQWIFNVNFHKKMNKKIYFDEMYKHIGGAKMGQKSTNCNINLGIYIYI